MSSETATRDDAPVGSNGLMGSLGTLVTGLVAAAVMLAFAILSFFVTVFIVQVGAGLAGYSPTGDFVVLSAALLTAGAIAAGGQPMSRLGTAL